MDAVKYNTFSDLKVGLGTDCSGGYSPSMINSLRFGIATSNNVLLAKNNEGSFMDYKGAISLATRGSAKVCSLEDKVGGKYLRILSHLPSKHASLIFLVRHCLLLEEKQY